MRRTPMVIILLIITLCISVVHGPKAFAQAQIAPPVLAPENHLSDPFATGWMLVDTNGDGLADAIPARSSCTKDPSAAENAAAANLAARTAYGSTGSHAAFGRHRARKFRERAAYFDWACRERSFE